MAAAGGAATESDEKVGQEERSESPQGEPEPPPQLRPIEGILLFRNEDVLRGQLRSIDAQDGIAWTRNGIAEPVRFATNAVSTIRLVSKRKLSRVEGLECRLGLSNGDLLSGRLIEETSDHWVMRTRYGAQISVPRGAIRQVEPITTQQDLVYEGPDGIEAWTVGKVVIDGDEKGEWHYKDGAIYAAEAASIAREVNLPAMARIEMDLAWQGMLNLAIALYTDYWQPINLRNRAQEPEFGGFYSLQINNLSALLMSVRQDFPLRRLSIASVSSLNQRNQAHLEILVDKSEAKITLLLNGDEVKTWTDDKGFIAEGTGLRFVHQGTGRIKLSNLRVSHWDGTRSHAIRESLVQKQDALRLKGGKLLLGTLEKIAEDKVRFTADGSSRTLPFSKVSVIQVLRAGAEFGSDPDGPTVLGTFKDGGRAAFELLKWRANGEVVVESPIWGEATLDADAFKELRFGASGVSPGPRDPS